MNENRPPLRPAPHLVAVVVLANALIAAMVFAQVPKPGSNSHNIGSTLATLPVHLPAQPPALLVVPPRLTILFLGVDSTGCRTRFAGARSDTTMVVTVDLAAKSLTITSIPRDSRVYIKGHGLTKINAAHAFGGHRLTAATVSDAFGIPIDRYVVLDSASLRKICELIGPLEVVVEKRMNYIDRAGRLRINLMPGRQLLSPAQVEQYVRFRHDADSDIGRIQRQQWFIRQAFSKVCSPSFLWKLPRLIPIARESIRTDLSLADMFRITLLAQEIKQREIVTASLPGHPASIGGISYWVLDVASTKAIFKRIYASEHPDSASSCDERLRIAIEYPAGSELDALGLEHSLIQLGHDVKLKRTVQKGDCMHEHILLSSVLVSRTTLNHMRRAIPAIASWPEVIGSQRPNTDVIFVISRRRT